MGEGVGNRLDMPPPTVQGGGLKVTLLRGGPVGGPHGGTVALGYAPRPQRGATPSGTPMPRQSGSMTPRGATYTLTPHSSREAAPASRWSWRRRLLASLQGAGDRCDDSATSGLDAPGSSPGVEASGQRGRETEGLKGRGHDNVQRFQGASAGEAEAPQLSRPSYPFAARVCRVLGWLRPLARRGWGCALFCLLSVCVAGVAGELSPAFNRRGMLQRILRVRCDW